MPEGFVHSVKVPRLYKTAASTIKKIFERKASLKELVYERKHPNVKAIYALATTTLQHSSQLTELLEKTNLLKKEPRLDQWLARILITELIWGKQSLQSEAKPIITIKNYENKLRDALKNTSNNEKSITKVEKPRYVRVNTLIMSVEDAIQELKNDGFTMLPKSRNYASYLKSLESLDTWSFIQDFHVRELFAFKAGTAFYAHDGYKSGALVLQDKASCLPGHLLNPPPGSVVLDMCAAPGMKTTHLAAILKNKGKIYSIEMNDRRYQLLCDFIQSSGTNIVTTINADALTITSNEYPDIEYILVDPSCSGSGMDRPEIDESTNKNDPSRLISLQSFQVFLLRHALFNFPSVKRVVYSTCSIYAEENEMVVDEILNDVGDAYKLIPIKKMFNNEWINYSSVNFNCKDNCLYARPKVDYSNGFFVAVFERNFDVPLPEFKKFKVGLKDQPMDESNNNDKFNNNQGKKRKRKNKLIDNEQGAGKNELVVNGNNESGRKKKKKKELINDGKLIIDNTDDNKADHEKKKSLSEEDNNVEKNETNGEKKKKKKKKSITEEVKEEEKNFEVTNTKKKKLLTEEVKNVEKNETNVEKKKKKKKKKSLTEEVEDVEKNDLNGEETIVKKKKKLLAEEVKVDEKAEENMKKVDKKNKKKLSREEVNGKVNDKENTEDVEKKEKKQKKRKYDSVDENKGTENDDSNRNITKKKKKKT